MKIQFPNIAIVGTGAMGRGIAQIAAQAGSQVLLLDAHPGIFDAAWWRGVQAKLRAGGYLDVPPYPDSARV